MLSCIYILMNWKPYLIYATVLSGWPNGYISDKTIEVQLLFHDCIKVQIIVTRPSKPNFDKLITVNSNYHVLTADKNLTAHTQHFHSTPLALSLYSCAATRPIPHQTTTPIVLPRQSHDTHCLIHCPCNYSSFCDPWAGQFSNWNYLFENLVTV